MDWLGKIEPSMEQSYLIETDEPVKKIHGKALVSSHLED